MASPHEVVRQAHNTRYICRFNKHFLDKSKTGKYKVFSRLKFSSGLISVQLLVGELRNTMLLIKELKVHNFKVEF